MREIIFFICRGVLIVLAIVTLFAAGELSFGPAADDIRSLVSLLASTVAVSLVALQHFFFRRRDIFAEQEEELALAKEEIEAYKVQAHTLDRERRFLRQQVESLSAHREISRAATAHTTLEDLLNEMVGVVHDLAGAREVSVFISGHQALPPTPRAHYRMSDPTGLYLSFSEDGGREISADLEGKFSRGQSFSAEDFAARSLSVSPEGRHIVVAGVLDYRNREVGTVRLTLHHIQPEDTPSAAVLTSLLAAALGNVFLDSPQALGEMVRQNQKRYDAGSHLVSIAQPLHISGEPIGIVRVSFDCRGENKRSAEIAERAKILAESARHISRAIQSERIYEQAIRDSLTKLFNKRYMLTQLAAHFNAAQRNSSHLSLILLDIDHFKNVNDTHGHLTGDKILRGVSQILREGVRNCDVACRYGGEELAVLLPEGSLKGTFELAERLRRRLEAHPFVSEAGVKMTITASMGVAGYRAEMIRIDELIADADTALYRAKEAGRNRVMLWEREDSAMLQ